LKKSFVEFCKTEKHRELLFMTSIRITFPNEIAASTAIKAHQFSFSTGWNVFETHETVDFETHLTTGFETQKTDQLRDTPSP
jgi:hypothetical protein